MVMRGATIVLTLTLSPALGWTAGVWHGAAAHPATRLASAPQSSSAGITLTPDDPILTHDDVEPPPEPSEGSAPSTLGKDEATPAVATYRRDEEGELYEEHSPQTEVARLREPVG